MRSSIAVLAASALGALAQEASTVSLFLGGPGLPGQEWVGSVVTAGPSDTAYEIMCTATAVCGTYSVPNTVTIGPSHLDYHFVTETMGIDATASKTCKMSGTTSAICTVHLDLDYEITGVTSGKTNIAVTTSYSGADMAGIPVTLTAGVEKLSAATPASGSSNASGSGSAASSLAAGAPSVTSTSSSSGASSAMASSRSGEILALVMFSAVSVSLGALMIL